MNMLLSTIFLLAELYVPSSFKRVMEIEQTLAPKAEIFFQTIDERGRWDELAKAPEAQEFIRKVENDAKLPIPDFNMKAFRRFFEPGDGDRREFEGAYFTRLGRLNDLVLAECLENRGRFLPQVVKYIEAILDEPTWVVPAHLGKMEYLGKTDCIDLFSSQRAYGLALTLRLLESRLDDGLKDRLRGMIRERVVLPYLKAAQKADYKEFTGAKWFFVNYNWNRVCHSQSLGTVLLMCDDRHERAQAIEFTERASASYLSGIKDDGYCVEGCGYWDYGFGHHLLAAVNIYNATHGKVNILAGEKNRISARFAVDIMLNRYGIAPSFADGGGSVELPQLKICERFWPKDFPTSLSKDLNLYKSLVGGSRWPMLAPYVILAFDALPKTAEVGSSEELPIRSWFSSAKTLICRIPGSDFAVAIKAVVRPDIHGHIDAGTYVVMDGENRISGDVGGEIYTARTFSRDRYISKVLNSYGHPVPRVAEMNQFNIFHREPPDLTTMNAGKVIKTDFSDEEDVLVTDLTDAYPCENLISLKRAYRFNRVNKTFTVVDRVKFSKPTAFETALMTKNPELMKDRYTISAKGGEWTVVEEVLTGTQPQDPTRYAIRFTEPVCEAEVVVKFH